MTAAAVLGSFAAAAAGTRPGDAGTRARAAEVLLDCLGVALAGSRETVASAVVDPGEGGRPEATVLGRDLRLPAAVAALANGTAAHALDYDDVQQPWYGHPTAVLLPAVLAVAERLHRPGADLVTGYLVGLAVGDALGEQLNPGHYDRGWHPTATLGTIAAAAGCATVCGATPEEAAGAVGIAASLAAGLRANFGSDVKAVHAGLAARNGVTAALMAQRGIRAAAPALDDGFGFAGVLGGRPLDDEALRAHLAEGVAAPLRRVGLKRYPACAATNPAVDAVLALRTRHGIDPDTVQRVECVVEPLATSLLTFARPRSAAEARFSLQHCLAAALVDGELGLRQFATERIDDPAVRRLAARVQVVTDPDIAPTGDFPATVTVALAGDRVLRESVAQAVGKPRSPMGRTDVLAKYRATAAVGVPPPVVTAGQELLDIEACADVGRWTAALRGVG
jgi:2-methylcitrate dehydratase PrpD